LLMDRDPEVLCFLAINKINYIKISTIDFFRLTSGIHLLMHGIFNKWIVEEYLNPNSWTIYLMRFTGKWILKVYIILLQSSRKYIKVQFTGLGKKQ
jgi:hypothetical protein